MVAVFNPVGGDEFEFLEHASSSKHERDLLGQLVREEIPPWNWRTFEYRMIAEDDNRRRLRRSDAPSTNIGELVLRHSAVTVLLPTLRHAGCEFVPLRCPDAKVVLVAPPRIDAFDEIRSDLSRMPGSPHMVHVRQFAFHPRPLETAVVFKTATRGITSTFVTDKFVSVWRRARLVGLTFNKLWEG